MKISDLKQAVDNLNFNYMKRSNNEFEVSGAYGGHKVILTGKYRKVGKKWVQKGMSGAVSITNGYNSATETLAQLGLRLSSKVFWDQIKSYEK